jgi:predicted phage tail protein
MTKQKESFWIRMMNPNSGVSSKSFLMLVGAGIAIFFSLIVGGVLIIETFQFGDRRFSGGDFAMFMTGMTALLLGCATSKIFSDVHQIKYGNKQTDES